MKRETPSIVRYALRGTAGDESANEELELGDELLIVARLVVSRVSEQRAADGVLIQTAQCTASAAAILEELPAGIRKQLDAQEAARMEGTDRLAL